MKEGGFLVAFFVFGAGKVKLRLIDKNAYTKR